MFDQILKFDYYIISYNPAEPSVQAVQKISETIQDIYEMLQQAKIHKNKCNVLSELIDLLDHCVEGW